MFNLKLFFQAFCPPLAERHGIFVSKYDGGQDVVANKAHGPDETDIHSKIEENKLDEDEETRKDKKDEQRTLEADNILNLLVW